MASSDTPTKQNQTTIDNQLMRLALVEALRSPEKFKVGACVVDKDDRVVGTGHNTEMFKNLRKRARDSRAKYLEQYLYINLAAAAALSRTYDYRGCTLYLTTYPTQHCAKEIVTKGIERIVYYNDKRKKLSEENMYAEADEILDAAEVHKSPFHVGVIEDEITLSIRKTVGLDDESLREMDESIL